MQVNPEKSLSIEEMQLPRFHFNEVEALYFNDLTIPAELYNEIAQKDRQLLLEDLQKVLEHAVDKVALFNAPGVDTKHTYAPWHCLFLLRDLAGAEALSIVLNFLQQDEDTLALYLGDGMSEFGWELLYSLANQELPRLVEFFKGLQDDYHIRVEVVEALKQIALHEPMRQMEVQGYLRSLLLFTCTVDMDDDFLIDEVADNLLEAIGEMQYTRLFPEIEKLFAEDKLPPLFLMSWETFAERYITTVPAEKPALKPLRTREEIYEDCMLNFEDDGLYDEDENDEVYEDDDDEDVDEIDINDYLDSMYNGKQEDQNDEYIDYDEIQKPFVKTEPDVGRNEPCPCGSGKKYKKCHGKA